MTNTAKAMALVAVVIVVHAFFYVVRPVLPWIVDDESRGRKPSGPLAGVMSVTTDCRRR